MKKKEVDKLKPEEIVNYTVKILKELLIFIEREEEEVHPDLLKGLVSLMDDLDGDDYFGSEGWKHYFGME